MAEVKNVFIKGKMNKDLDERLIPKGEYREAQNILISESEDSDSGAVENILGNKTITDSSVVTANNTTEVIGSHTDIKSKKVFYFITDFNGITGDVLDIKSITRTSNANNCKIIMVDTTTGQNYILMEGQFLNFSKKHLITGVNLIDDLLFWTDNYNQPRKININNCYPSIVNPNGNSSYYTLEEQISVAKIAPYTPAVLVEQVLSSAISPVHNRVTATTVVGTLPSSGTFTSVATTSSGDGSGAVVTVVVAGGNLSSLLITTIGSGYLPLDTLVFTIDTDKVVTITLQDNDFIFGGDGTTLTKDNNINSEYLQERFVRFSYRYKFEDGEYSIMAPFTQIIFSPLNDAEIYDPRDVNAVNDVPYTKGYGIEEIYKKGVVKIMQNFYNKIKIRIPLPSEDEFNTTANVSWVNKYKLSNIEILTKEADGLAVKVVDNIKVNNTTNFTNNIEEYRVSPESGGSRYKRKYYVYTYKSEEPYKVLSEEQTIRVFDQVPVKAKAQEVSGNRVIYGNYTENYTLPKDESNRTGINYTVGLGAKGSKEITSGSPSEHGNLQHLEVAHKHNSIKQRRTYQVGIVLADRFGRQSPVILSTNTGEITDTYTIPNDSGSYYGYYVVTTQTGSTSGSSATVTLTAPNSLIEPDQLIIGTGVVAGTQVVSISGTNLTLSTPNDLTGIELSFKGYSWSSQELSIGKALNIMFKDTRLVPFANAANQNRSHELYNGNINDTCLIASRELTLPTSNVMPGGLPTASVSSFTPQAGGGLVTTTNGSGTGLTLKINANAGSIVKATVMAVGSGYKVGDEVTVADAVMEADNGIGTTNGDLVMTLTIDDIKSFYNPHGWYSWKVVVKQNEQEYYNVYAPHPADNWNNVDHKWDDTKNGRSWLTLHGDNINKIPRDISELDASRPGVSASSVRVFPKVVSNASTPYWSQRNSDGTEFIEIISVGTAKDQNLYLQANKSDLYGDDSGTSGFSILPFIHGHEKNPIVAELSNLSLEAGTDNPGGIKGSIATDVVAGNGTTTIEVLPQGVPLGTIIVGDIMTGPKVTPRNVNLGVAVGSVSGANIGITTSALLDPASLDESDRLFFSHYKEGLSVFETEPFKSKLDIYYETSTSGLIRDLNENQETTTDTPTGLKWNDDATYKTIPEASSSTPTPYTIGTLTATAVGVGNSITGYTLLAVQDDAAVPNDKSSFFTVVAATGVVKTNGDFARFSSTGNVDGRDTFTLTFQFTQTDGGTATGYVTVKTTNSNPTITSTFNDGTGGSPKTAPVPVGAAEDHDVCNGTAENGAAWSQYDTYGLTTSSYSYTFPSNRFEGWFAITQTSPGSWEVTTTASYAIGTNAATMMTYSDANRMMTVTVTDPEGLTATHVIRIDIIPVRYSFLTDEEDEGDFYWLNSKMSYSNGTDCAGSFSPILSGWVEQGDATSTPVRGVLEVGNVIYTAETNTTRQSAGGYKWEDSNFKTWVASHQGGQPPSSPYRKIVSVTECT